MHDTLASRVASRPRRKARVGVSVVDYVVVVILSAIIAASLTLAALVTLDSWRRR